MKYHQYTLFSVSETVDYPSYTTVTVGILCVMNTLPIHPNGSQHCECLSRLVVTLSFVIPLEYR